MLNNVWATITSWYQAYSGFVHSIFPSALGDLVVWVINIAVACLIVKLVATVAFKTKSE